MIFSIPVNIALILKWLSSYKTLQVFTKRTSLTLLALETASQVGFVVAYFSPTRSVVDTWRKLPG